MLTNILFVLLLFGGSWVSRPSIISHKNLKNEDGKSRLPLALRDEATPLRNRLWRSPSSLVPITLSSETGHRFLIGRAGNQITRFETTYAIDKAPTKLKWFETLAVFSGNTRPTTHDRFVEGTWWNSRVPLSSDWGERTSHRAICPPAGRLINLPCMRICWISLPL